MKRISKNWIIEPRLDFEYKKYSLLAYLQVADKDFSMNKIYPHLKDLESCEASIQHVLRNRDQVRAEFPSRLSGINTSPPRLEYDQSIPEGNTLREVEEIASFSLKRIGEAVNEGRARIKKIQNKLDFFPIGVHSSWEDEGFILVRKQPHVIAFKYLVSRISGMDHTSTIQLKWLRRFRDTTVDRFDKLKLELVRSESGLAPSAAFGIVGVDEFPLKGAILPIASRHISDWVTQKKRADIK